MPCRRWSLSSASAKFVSPQPSMIAAKPLPIGGSLHIEAIGATILAALTVLAWIAIGSVAVRGWQAGDPVTLPVCILVGSGITSFALSLVALGGAVAGGTIGTAAVSLLILATRWKQAVRIAGSALRSYSRIAHPRI